MYLQILKNLYNNIISLGEGSDMISALIGLHTAIAMRHNATMGLCMNNSWSKSADLQRANNATMLKLANAQQDYYQKLLDDNIKRSFNIFA